MRVRVCVCVCVCVYKSALFHELYVSSVGQQAVHLSTSQPSPWLPSLTHLHHTTTASWCFIPIPSPQNHHCLHIICMYVQGQSFHIWEQKEKQSCVCSIPLTRDLEQNCQLTATCDQRTVTTTDPGRQLILNTRVWQCHTMHTSNVWTNGQACKRTLTRGGIPWTRISGTVLDASWDFCE